METNELLPRDVEQIAALGMSEADVLSQIALFRSPPPFADLVRPCRVGDGVSVIPEEEHRALLTLHEEAARAGRLLKFVPASGAASRMFQSVSHVLEDDRTSTFQEIADQARGGNRAAAEVVALLDGLDRLPFAGALAEAAGRDAVADRTGRFRELLTAMLAPSGLGLAALPKALVPFHAEEEGTRTALEEHLVEGALTVRDSEGGARLHLTVGEAARASFERVLAAHRPALEEKLLTRFDVTFSVQDPSTDTIAVDEADRPFRLADGSILFRPGGHGALLGNLAALPRADIVFVKNVDNVVPDARKGPTLLWKKLLAGTLLRLERRVRHLLAMLAEEPDDPGHVEEALGFLEDELGRSARARVRAQDPARRAAVVGELLDRPLRVCGVVRNQGEPGGGPFWVRGADGTVTPQIVEGSQVDPRSPSQQAIWSASTHFNPVDLVLSLTSASGAPHDLARYVDPSTVFLSTKSRDGRTLKALERPGLWNGAMAGWLTALVEVPIETFAPVKTVLDLLRPEHQPD